MVCINELALNALFSVLDLLLTSFTLKAWLEYVAAWEVIAEVIDIGGAREHELVNVDQFSRLLPHQVIIPVTKRTHLKVFMLNDVRGLMADSLNARPVLGNRCQKVAMELLLLGLLESKLSPDVFGDVSEGAPIVLIGIDISRVLVIDREILSCEECAHVVFPRWGTKVVKARLGNDAFKPR